MNGNAINYVYNLLPNGVIKFLLIIFFSLLRGRENIGILRGDFFFINCRDETDNVLMNVVYT